MVVTDSTDPSRPTEIRWEPPADQIQIELKRNGASEDVTASITQVINTLRFFENSLRELRNFIRDWVPQVGWRFEWEISLFSGQVYFTWGWKEHTDNRVFYGWAGGTRVTIFSGSVTLSFGVQMTSALLVRVEGTIAGELQGNFQVERTTLDEPLVPGRASLEATTTINGTIQGRASAGIGWVRFEARAGVRSGLEVLGAIRAEEGRGIYLYAKVKWTGIVVFAVTSNPDSGESEDTYNLMDERMLYDGPVPRPEQS